jgi:hypothetical protein
MTSSDQSTVEIPARGGLTAVKDFLKRNEELVRRSGLLLILFCLAAIVGIRMSASVIDPDIWWHLRTGKWIAEHGFVPLTDPFSLHGADKVWIAYSWLFEVLVFRMHQWFGLSGIVYFNVGMDIAITIALFALITRLESRFIIAVGLTAATVVAMLTVLLTPRPWLFTILFFTIELTVLLSARRSGRMRALWGLPLLFALWANLHIQFVYGLLVLGLAVAECFLTGIIRRFSAAVDATAAKAGQMALVMLACIAATLGNPYHYKVYFPVFDYVGQSGFYEVISELQSPQFRTLADWLVLALVAGAAFVLGRRQTISPFVTLLLATAIMISFRSRRDIWLVVIAAAATIATSRSHLAGASGYLWTRKRIAGLAVAIVLVVVFTMRAADLSEHTLQRRVSAALPADAAAVIEQRGYKGPLYNHFNWGGYLIWRLPSLPVAIDGRTNVYGIDRMKQSLNVWTGKTGWNSDAELASAGLVLARLDQPLNSLLRLDPRFDLVYEDKVAAVFVARDRRR